MKRTLIGATIVSMMAILIFPKQEFAEHIEKYGPIVTIVCLFYLLMRVEKQSNQ